MTDSRFQAIMPDPLHWLGVTKIHKLVSMSNMKYDAIVGSGIKVVERVPIPPELVPKVTKSLGRKEEEEMVRGLGRTCRQKEGGKKARVD